MRVSQHPTWRGELRPSTPHVTFRGSRPGAPESHQEAREQQLSQDLSLQVLSAVPPSRSSLHHQLRAVPGFRPLLGSCTMTLSSATDMAKPGYWPRPASRMSLLTLRVLLLLLAR